MADIPVAPIEGGANAREMLFATEDDGATGLRAALFTSIESDVVNGQRLGVLSVAPPIASNYNGPTGVSVGAASVQALAANADRVSAIFTNDSDTAIYLSLGVAAQVNMGIRLNAYGGSYEINWTNMWRGLVYAVSTAAGKTLCVMEVYE